MLPGYSAQLLRLSAAPEAQQRTRGEHLDPQPAEALLLLGQFGPGTFLATSRLLPWVRNAGGGWWDSVWGVGCVLGELSEGESAALELT